MSRLRIPGSVFAAVVACVVTLASVLLLQRATAQGPEVQAALGTAFTYQGQLQNNGAPANGNFDFQFILYDAAVGGSQVPSSPIVTKNAVPVANGLFTTQLDFGNVFGNSQLFLDIGVRPAGGSSYTPLTPRQELTPAPFARYALNAGSAVVAQSAQSVAWSNVTGKPGPVTRQIIVPGGAMSFSPSAQITQSPWGTRLTASAPEVSFVLPRPSDWDQTQPFTLTLYFALPTAPTAGTINWRLNAGSSNLNLPPEDAGTGWDSLDFSQSRDAGSLNFASSGGRSNVVKSQAWVAQFSSTFNTWYMSTAVTTNNDFSNDPIWQFSFQRGAAVSNGESYTGDLVIVAAELSYVSK
ncbi:MAG: hypothetical protein MUD01_18960 [Chloroflexaceae bacterium]|nr:hypothetical protein [Chloroflexaceae bacterium]